MATDNSNQAPQITVSPAGVTSPYTFYTSTVITYTATDASGNKDECSFEVSLQGQKYWGIYKRLLTVNYRFGEANIAKNFLSLEYG